MTMKFAKAFDKLPRIVKILLTIFFDFITGGLYRLLKGLEKKNIVLIVAGIIWLCTLGWGIGWIIDIVCIIVKGKYTFLA